METLLGEGQASVEQALENQCKGILDEVQVRGRKQENALIAQNTTTTQVLKDLENINSQMQALLISEKSIVGFDSV